MENIKVFDVIIIGGGPAGLAAGLYASRAKLEVVSFEKLVYGGQVVLTDKIENYPSVTEASGSRLASNFYNHAVKFGLSIVTSGISKIEERTENGRNIFALTDECGKVYNTISIIVATGAHWRKLGVPGENKFQGRGVSYCATCDGPLYKDKNVVVVGGGNSAVEGALFLTKFVKKLTLIHRRSMLRAAKILQEELFKNKKVDVKLDTVISEIKGTKRVEKIVIKNGKTGGVEELYCEGVFVFIGQDPNTDLVKDLVKLNENNFIITDEEMRTSKEGIFAAGDVRRKVLRQVVTAASDGAIAAHVVEQYVRKLKGEEYK